MRPRWTLRWGLLPACVMALCAGNTLSGCYTQLAIPPSPDVTESSLSDDDSEEYFAPSRRSPYPEDYLLDPYYSGMSYYNNYSDPVWGGSGYGSYYVTPWWLDPRYHTGGSGRADTTRVRRRAGRQLWDNAGQPPIPPVTGDNVYGEIHDATSGEIGVPGTSPDKDSTGAQQKDGKSKKKGTGRRLWR